MDESELRTCGRDLARMRRLLTDAEDRVLRAIEYLDDNPLPRGYVRARRAEGLTVVLAIRDLLDMLTLDDVQAATVGRPVGVGRRHG